MRCLAHRYDLNGSQVFGNSDALPADQQPTNAYELGSFPHATQTKVPFTVAIAQ
jgi:hypothetical protein